MHSHPFSRHPSLQCPDTTEVSFNSLIVDESMVLSYLQAFPKSTSPGASKSNIYWMQLLGPLLLLLVIVSCVLPS